MQIVKVQQIVIKLIMVGFNRIIVIGVFLTFVLMSCSGEKNQNKEQKENNSQQEFIKNQGDLNETSSGVKVEFSDKVIQKGYESYLLIKAALVNSNSDQVRIEAKKLLVICEELPEGEQLKAVVQLISLTKKINKQRDFFATLTTEIEKLVNRVSIQSGKIYKQFCPMAFEGEGGYWLSNSKEIRNPYYGNRMLNCGNVTDVFQ